MLGKRLLTTLLLSILASMVYAGSKDLCTPGSDSECARFGTNMCCAKIQYTFKGDSQDFYACASRPGIEYSGGQIYDQFGFSGTWFCAGAIKDYAFSAAAAVLAVAAVNF